MRRLSLILVGIAAFVLLLSPHRPHPAVTTRWYDDDIYDEIASGPAD